MVDVVDLSSKPEKKKGIRTWYSKVSIFVKWESEESITFKSFGETHIKWKLFMI